MIDFSKRTKKTKLFAGIVCGVIVVAMVLSLLVAFL